MTKRQRESAERNAKPLFDFLDSYDARLLSRWTAQQPSAKKRVMHSYLINGHTAIVTIGESGWDIFVPTSKENNVADALLNAAAFLGPRSGDDSLKYRVGNLDSHEDQGRHEAQERQALDLPSSRPERGSGPSPIAS